MGYSRRGNLVFFGDFELSTFLSQLKFDLFESALNLATEDSKFIKFQHNHSIRERVTQASFIATNYNRCIHGIYLKSTCAMHLRVAQVKLSLIDFVSQDKILRARIKNFICLKLLLCYFIIVTKISRHAPEARHTRCQRPHRNRSPTNTNRRRTTRFFQLHF